MTAQKINEEFAFYLEAEVIIKKAYAYHDEEYDEWVFEDPCCTPQEDNRWPAAGIVVPMFVDPYGRGPSVQFSSVADWPGVCADRLYRFMRPRGSRPGSARAEEVGRVYRFKIYCQSKHASKVATLCTVLVDESDDHLHDDDHFCEVQMEDYCKVQNESDNLSGRCSITGHVPEGPSLWTGLTFRGLWDTDTRQPYGLMHLDGILHSKGLRWVPCAPYSDYDFNQSGILNT